MNILTGYYGSNSIKGAIEAANLEGFNVPQQDSLETTLFHQSSQRATSIQNPFSLLQNQEIASKSIEEDDNSEVAKCATQKSQEKLSEETAFLSEDVNSFDEYYQTRVKSLGFFPPSLKLHFIAIAQL